MATHGCHWTLLVVDGATVFNQLPLMPLSWVVNRLTFSASYSQPKITASCGVVGLISNEELEFLEPEGVLGGVGTDLAVFAWP